MNKECSTCNKKLTKIEVDELYDECFECHQNMLCKELAHHLREARITFEEVIRKLLIEADK